MLACLLVPPARAKVREHFDREDRKLAARQTEQDLALVNRGAAKRLKRTLEAENALEHTLPFGSPAWASTSPSTDSISSSKLSMTGK